jgi:dTDP-4-amino-4,6-dideoxygalactose transaminase
VANGTEALQLALMACGVGAGDVVITSPHTASATAAAILLVGAKPLLIDIDEDTFTIDCNRIEAALKQHREARVKAIIPVHLYGQPVDMPALMEIAQRNQLRVIEDCAQSHGAMIGGRKTGCWGDVAAFSFYPTKNLGALGDGGAVATSDPALAERLRLLRQYGWRTRYVSETTGMNSRLDELQAAILRVKLRHLDAENRARRDAAAFYQKGLAGLPLRLPVEGFGGTHVYHQYTIRTAKRGELQSWLTDRQIGSSILYPEPIHRQAWFQSESLLDPAGLKICEKVADEILSLPMHPQLASKDLKRVVDAIIAWASHSPA